MTAPGSGAEIIPFLKTWVNLPMAIGFTILYAKVSRASPALSSSAQRCSVHTLLKLGSFGAQNKVNIDYSQGFAKANTVPLHMRSCSSPTP